jgi:parallel beta-helix repeat protein
MSHNNTISGNTVTGITGASGIGLQGDSDNCLISNNSVTDCSMTANAAIMVYGKINDKVAENNVIKNNVVKNNTYPGIWLYSGAGNTVGPNNTVNENDLYGIYLSWDADGNHIFNNTALNNTPCDISDFSTGTNTFSNNTADCTEGF